VTEGADDLGRSDYASAFEVSIAEGDGRSPEQWARAVFEGAPTPGCQERRGPAYRGRARRSWRAGPRLSCGHLQEPVVPARSQRPLRRRAEATQRWSCGAGSTERRQSHLRPPVRL